ncbi:hypothetical protein ZIOFF_032911 [Zingiber officinale]|uniref:XPG-I domain-containing protein n=1 Tax=Zingiber officinale TaxID=94328 RepID=A0A8J5LBX0_ZINOF|nr:hypothetical protein ZIOFF_032911 [Zingiber officinale]
MAPKPLDYKLLNENVKKVAYAVKGELYLRASELYVFGGQPPELKKQELAKRLVFTVLSLSPSFFFFCKIMIIFMLILFFRYLKRKDATNDLNTTIETGDLEGIEKYNKRTVKVTKQHNKDCRRLLRLMGVPTIEAPCEAEAQCTALFKSDKAFAVASENMDTLTFGVLEELRLTMDQFIDLCILSGCDYCDNIKGRAIREA